MVPSVWMVPVLCAWSEYAKGSLRNDIPYAKIVGLIFKKT